VSSPTTSSNRAATLQEYSIDTSTREAEFDTIASAAVRATGAPVALLGFLGEDREWIKAAAGWNIHELPLASSFAAWIEGQRDLVVVPDTALDARFRTHPLVIAAPYVRFFAGVPLIDAEGRYLGALSVLDRTPRMPSSEQANAFRALGKEVVRKLAARRSVDGRPVDREELTRLREMLEESEARFRDFFEQTDDLVISISSDGRLLHANDATFQILGYTREELRGQLMTVVDPEVRESFRTVLKDVFSSGESQRVETIFVTSGGRRMTVEGFLRPRVIDGRAVMARVIFRDISDRKQFESDLASARDAALESARLKTQFLTNVSHEIRTPMNGIIGTIDLLLSTPLAPEQLEYAHHARTSGEQLLSIVNNILYVSNLEAGSLAGASVDFDLFRTLQRIVEVMKIAALGKDLDVRFEFDPALPLIVRGSQPRIRQVITNLMENAAKFTDQGHIELRVSLQTETDSHRLIRFEVKDSGIGISPQDRVLLFEKFSQIDAGSTRRFQGIGLGLATARQLVETMGGIIDVDSVQGEGSNFWFSVPFPKSTGTRRPIATSELDFKGKRVLLIDHLPTSRKIVSHYLETTWGMPVAFAETGSEALKEIRTAAAGGDPIRVVVFDALPDIDTAKFAHQIRDDKAIAGTSLIYLVATRGETNVEKLREFGINSYVAKPVGQGELFDALTIALAQDAIPLARSAVAPHGSAGVAIEVTPEARRATRVLLAEDNFLNRKLTMSQLEKLGYTAESVINGQEAVEAVSKNAYDIVLMDCQMPIVDGYEATMEIRRLEKSGTKHHRIIAMTANALEGDREKCLAAGMDDYLSKPTNHDDLAKALARFFEKRV
jgi:two-component system, sensor histidine kinase and response regulator